MTKSVVWISCSRLSCASAQSPDVVLCVTDPALLAPITCSPEDYTPATIDAVLTKVWKDVSPCGEVSWRYILNYDENDLADPTVALTTAQVDGVFCQGCLTTYIQDQVRRILCEES